MGNGNAVDKPTIVAEANTTRTREGDDLVTWMRKSQTIEDTRGIPERTMIFHHNNTTIDTATVLGTTIGVETVAIGTGHRVGRRAERTWTKTEAENAGWTKILSSTLGAPKVDVEYHEGVIKGGRDRRQPGGIMNHIEGILGGDPITRFSHRLRLLTTSPRICGHTIMPPSIAADRIVLHP